MEAINSILGEFSFTFVWECGKQLAFFQSLSRLIKCNVKTNANAQQKNMYQCVPKFEFRFHSAYFNSTLLNAHLLNRYSVCVFIIVRLFPP